MISFITKKVKKRKKRHLNESILNILDFKDLKEYTVKPVLYESQGTAENIHITQTFNV